MTINQGGFIITKYEKSIMFNVHVMKVAFVVITILNLALPIYKTGYKFSIFQCIVPIIWFYGLLNGIGYFKQEVPVLGIGILRIFEGLFYFIIARSKFNWGMFLIFIIMDILYAFFFYLDRNSYYYIDEVEEDNSYDN